MVEEEVDEKIFPIDFDRHLLADEGEAGAQFDEEFADVIEQPVLQLALRRIGGEAWQSEAKVAAGVARPSAATLSSPSVKRFSLPPSLETTKRCAGRGISCAVIGSVVNTKAS